MDLVRKEKMYYTGQVTSQRPVIMANTFLKKGHYQLKLSVRFKMHNHALDKLS